MILDGDQHPTLTERQVLKHESDDGKSRPAVNLRGSKLFSGDFFFTSANLHELSVTTSPEVADVAGYLDQPLEREASKRSRSSIRVLLVDDFLPITSALANTLETNFYDVCAASSAAEGLAIAESFQPHALITDVILPDMTGFELVAEFAERHPDCCVLLMSASYDWAVQNRRGPRVVPKASIVEEAFRLLEYCRTLAVNSSTRRRPADSLDSLNLL
jgi:CheY-like chemotaxis protein